MRNELSECGRSTILKWLLPRVTLSALPMAALTCRKAIIPSVSGDPIGIETVWQPARPPLDSQRPG